MKQHQKRAVCDGIAWESQLWMLRRKDHGFKPNLSKVVKGCLQRREEREAAGETRKQRMEK